MEKNDRVIILFSSIVIGISLIAALGAHGWLLAHRQASTDGLTVSGSVKQKVTSDLAKWTAGFSHQANLTNVKDVMTQTEGDRQKLKEFITKLGIDDASIHFQPPQTSPVYEQLPGYGMTQNVIGYNVMQEVSVENTDIDKVEKLAGNVKDIVALGVVPDYQRTEYFYTKLNELRPQLYAQATEDAKVRAEAIAKGTGSIIGDPTAAKTGVIQVTAPNSTDISDYGAYDLSTKEKEVAATVSVTFSLKR
jgi:uncharacterized protein